VLGIYSGAFFDPNFVVPPYARRGLRADGACSTLLAGAFRRAFGDVNIFIQPYISIFSSDLTHNFISDYFFLSTADIGHAVATVKHTRTHKHSTDKNNKTSSM
jgi:hypothetical protein